MRRVFYVVVINTPGVMGIVGLVEEISWKPWKFIEETRSVKKIESAAIQKGHSVTYAQAHSLPSWAFEKLFDCVVDRYRKSFKISNPHEVDWEVFHRIVVYAERENNG